MLLGAVACSDDDFEMRILSRAAVLLQLAGGDMK